MLDAGARAEPSSAKSGSAGIVSTAGLVIVSYMGLTMLRRGDDLIFPRGDTTLLDGGRLTVIVRPEGITALRDRYGAAMS